MSELKALEEWAGALLVKLEPKERRRINQSIARDLRRSQQKRIRAQRNPDGTAYAPRKKAPQRTKSGRIKQQAMFRKLGAAARLKLASDSNSVGIGFMARNARIARVHQYGLKDRSGRNSKSVQYAKRELLGFSDADLDLIRDKLIDHLSEL